MKRIKNFFRILFKWIFRAIVAFFVLSILGVVVFRFVPVPITPLMGIRFVEQIFDEDRDIRFRKDWESLENISRHMVMGSIAAEDQNFMKHSGFDWKAIKSAYESNKKGRKVKGASTISQQTAKNVFLYPSRSYLRKGLEVYFTFLIETIWTKERIMEVYLNVIEMGNGIYGAEAAAQFYFDKPAEKLSKGECALIVATFPNPLKRRPTKVTNYMGNRKAWIMKNMDRMARPDFLKRN